MSAFITKLLCTSWFSGLLDWLRNAEVHFVITLAPGSKALKIMPDSQAETLLLLFMFYMGVSP